MPTCSITDEIVMDIATLKRFALAFERIRQSSLAIDHMGKSEPIPEFDVYVVWSCKTLQNCKVLISTSLPDGMYYECTFNGDKNEMYLDAYKKFENKCIKLQEE